MAPSSGRGASVAAKAGSLRAPRLSGGGATRPSTEAQRPALRLAVSRGQLGIELDAPFELGPLVVTDLALSFPTARFPIDLSGGVARFRHKRGALRQVCVEADPTSLSAWAAPRLRGLFAESSPDVFLAPIEGGLSLGLRSASLALAFDVLIAPLDGDVRLLPERARGIGLGDAPQSLALRALAAAMAPIGRVARGAVVIPGAAANLARHLLPAAGGRAPSADGLRWAAVALVEGGGGPSRLVLEGDTESGPPELSARTLRALELSDLAGDADAAAYAGEIDDARALYLAALERAPRHPEIAQRLAWIDVLAGGRGESALSTLVEALPATSAGVLGGILLEAVGDADGARVAFTRAAHAESYGALAALAWLEGARLAVALDERLAALDHAVARAPSLDVARWARLEARLDLADTRAARGDAEHLEAAARGAPQRLAVWRRAAEAFLARGFVADAGGLFERALRYAPDDVHALTGLGRSLRAAGQGARAVELFARAVALADRAEERAHAAEIELARALAEVAGDRPAAIARARAIPPGLPDSAEARFLEGRWRAELGDPAGAGIAFGRFRDAVELVVSGDTLRARRENDRSTAVAAMLVEAAELEERHRDDLHAAQRDLGLALRLRPRDGAIAGRFRRVAGLVAGLVAGPVAGPAAPPVVAFDEEIDLLRDTQLPSAPSEDEQATVDLELGDATVDVELDADLDDERLADQLTDKLRANPRDHIAAMRLARVLDRLGRDLDLLALLSARLDEGDAAQRAEVAPMRAEVLSRLAAIARAEGRASEAELYELMIGTPADP